VQTLQVPQALCIQPPRIGVAPAVITLTAGANDFLVYLAAGYVESWADDSPCGGRDRGQGGEYHPLARIRGPGLAGTARAPAFPESLSSSPTNAGHNDISRAFEDVWQICGKLAARARPDDQAARRPDVSRREHGPRA
jgi:hypothetical protein